MDSATELRYLTWFTGIGFNPRMLWIHKYLRLRVWACMVRTPYNWICALSSAWSENKDILNNFKLWTERSRLTPWKDITSSNPAETKTFASRRDVTCVRFRVKCLHSILEKQGFTPVLSKIQAYFSNIVKMAYKTTFIILQ